MENENMRFFADRFEAGTELASHLQHKTNKDLIVLALPRGGVPVGFEIAKALGAPLDIFLVRKLGVPGHEELAMGAITSNGARFLNPDVLDQIMIPQSAIDRVADSELREIRRREDTYRRGANALDIRNKDVILVDDGLATGSTMIAALRAVNAEEPRTVTVAVPVAPPSIYEDLKGEADEIICLQTPEPFWGVGQWYDDFSQLTDQEVLDLLGRAKAQAESQRIGYVPPMRKEESIDGQ